MGYISLCALRPADDIVILFFGVSIGDASWKSLIPIESDAARHFFGPPDSQARLCHVRFWDAPKGGGSVYG